MLVYLVSQFLCLLILTVCHIDAEYTPSRTVKIGHSFSRTEFDSTTNYLTQLLIIPGILFVVSIIGFIVLNLIYLFQYCCKCITCCGPREADRNSYPPEELAEIYKKKYRKWTVIIFVLCFLVVLVDQLFFIGSSYLNSGVIDVDDSLKFIKNIFTNLDDDGVSLTFYGTKLTSLLASTQCTYASSTISDSLTSYNSAVSSYTDVIDPVLSFTGDIRSGMHKYAEKYAQIGLYVLYAVVLLTVAIFMIFQMLAKKWGMVTAIICGQFMFVLITLLCLIWLITTSLVSDYCIDPINNISKMTSSNYVRNITTYYWECTGSTYIFEYTNEAKGYANTMNTSISELLYTPNSPCAGDTSLKSMLTYSNSILLTILDIEDNLECTPIQGSFWNLIDQGLCTNISFGLLGIWISQYITSILLFIIIIIGSIAYHYFDVRIEYSPPSNTPYF